MTTQTTIELNLNILDAQADAWVQTQNQGTGLAYTVTGGKRANVRDIVASNLGSYPVTFEYAVASGVSVSNGQRKLPKITIPSSGVFEGSRLHTIPEGSGLWVRVGGSGLNVTISASLLEISP